MVCVQVRPLSVSTVRCGNSNVKIDQYPDDKHATNKVKEGDIHNVQESNAKAGME